MLHDGHGPKAPYFEARSVHGFLVADSISTRSNHRPKLAEILRMINKAQAMRCNPLLQRLPVR